MKPYKSNEKNRGISTKTQFTAVGYFSFLFAVAFVAACSIPLYAALAQRQPEHMLFNAIYILANIFVLSAIYVVIDYYRRKMTVERPVRMILEATERITSGDFSVEPLHIYGKYDEYDLIMENINRMAAELSKSEVLKTNFIANVSHEIKTPLNLIQNYAALIQDENTPLQDRREYTEHLIFASKKLSALVGNILKLNKLENQKLSVSKKKIRLGDMVTNILLQFEESLDKKELELICDIDDVVIYSDESYIDIILNNLISNAIKFTDKGGTLSVSLKNSVDSVLFIISDTGCGMTPEIGANIFEKFYQGDTSHSQDGNGLGLALVKKVIDIIGGGISVESEVGKGSTFTVKLHRE